MVTIKKNSLRRPGNPCIRSLRFLFLALIALMLCLPLQAHAADKRVVILPLALYADPGKAYLRQGLRTMFLSRLAGEGVEIIAEEALAALLTQEEREGGITSSGRAEALAAGLRADYAVFGSVTAVGGGYSLDLSILEFKEGRAKVTNISEATDENQFIPKISEVVNQFRGVMAGVDLEAQRMARLRAMGTQEASGGKGLFFKPTAESSRLEPAGRISLRTSAMGLDTGDLDADGTPELVVLSRDRLMIYVRQGDRAALKDTLKASRGEEFLKVSAGDMDKNGKAEIYLVSLYGERARTCIWEWTGKFTRLHDRPGHFQVVRGFGGADPLLLFQDTKISKVFSGPISIMKYAGQGNFSVVETLNGLKDAQFYTLTAFDFNKNGVPEFVGLANVRLDEESPIHIWDKSGNVLWRGASTVGGTNNAVRVGTKEGLGDLKPRVAFNSRLTVADIDDDGEKEILAIKNIPMTEATMDFRIFKKAKLIAYKLEGAKLVQSWSTGNISYCLTDIQAEGDTIFLAASKDKITNIGKGTGRVMWFE